MTETHIVTIERHIIEEERRHPSARGAFSNILSDMALAAKVISREVNMAGLMDILGQAGHRNVQGEEVQKLDVFAQDVIYRAMDHTGHLCCMGSEEVEDILPIPEKFPAGDYVLLFDPLDGSSNIDVNVSIGTIFAIFRKVSGEERGALEDCIQPGRRSWPPGTSSTAPAPCWCTPPGTASTASPWIPPSGSSSSATPTSGSRSPRPGPTR
jgi:fructose-1,6-bisphosphatase I